ncbi:MAG: prenyltransferase, partial [Frankiales bacterium]|nr:prenyltransferase [Frankiales bacterium]
QPWVTGAETAELVLALDTTGATDRAIALLRDVQHLREADGSYWTGYQFAEDVNWPDEHSTWTAAAVVLAVDALSRTTPGSGIFRATTLPTGVDLIPDPACGCGSSVGLDEHS